LEGKNEVQVGFRIEGRVQGVFFRAWTRETALELGLRGTVRNRLDGSVEAHVAGSADTVETFRSRLWEGPPSARVDRVEALPSEEPLSVDSFLILQTV
jgi:acylphosphatase